MFESLVVAYELFMADPLVDHTAVMQVVDAKKTEARNYDYHLKAPCTVADTLNFDAKPGRLG